MHGRKDMPSRVVSSHRHDLEAHKLPDHEPHERRATRSATDVRLRGPSHPVKGNTRPTPTMSPPPDVFEVQP